MLDSRTDRVNGAILGLALGDAFGASHEGGILERALWSILGTSDGKRRWTDDTQMTIDVIESLLARGGVDQDDLAHRFAGSYRWSRGYGPGAAKTLKRIRRGESWQSAALAVFPQGSFGNGGAMRAPAVGLFFAGHCDRDIASAAGDVAAITHAHHLAREGAALIALATALACNGAEASEMTDRLSRCAESQKYRDRLVTARAWLDGGEIVTPRQVAAELGNGIAAVDSCVTAMYAALLFRNRPFDALLEFAIQVRGDVDTIAAMASAIWGAARGADQLPDALLKQLERRDDLERLASSLADAVASRGVRQHP